MGRDFYMVLEVSRTADADELKRAYRAAARKHHPDLNPDDDGAEARFKQVRDAYDLLKNPDKRAQYDRILALKESGQLDAMLQRARFSKVPFVPMEPPAAQPPDPPHRATDTPYPRIPADAADHPEIAGWWVAVPPGGMMTFLPNPHFDPIASAAQSSARWPERPSRSVAVLAELVDLIRRRRR